MWSRPYLIWVGTRFRPLYLCRRRTSVSGPVDVPASLFCFLASEMPICSDPDVRLIYGNRQKIFGNNTREPTKNFWKKGLNVSKLLYSWLSRVNEGSEVYIEIRLPKTNIKRSTLERRPQTRRPSRGGPTEYPDNLDLIGLSQLLMVVMRGWVISGLIQEDVVREGGTLIAVVYRVRPLGPQEELWTSEE